MIRTVTKGMSYLSWDSKKVLTRKGLQKAVRAPASKVFPLSHAPMHKVHANNYDTTKLFSGRMFWYIDNKLQDLSHEGRVCKKSSRKLCP